ncbi:DUF924 family protein [Sulfuricaulis sp.]|jgi:uncharacterized protein (DUF924 family)|uniref:DUF924 family protein n=1 Tax=Sulfuricaulis sp. TaxID=2003553 RepID=UPI00355946D1
MESIDSVLRYWFGNSVDEAEVIREKSGLWWKKNPDVDDEIRRRFEPMLESEIKGELTSWGNSPRGQLARILLLDQFPRNMYRGTARAFAYDERARRLAREALEQGVDRMLRPVERVFIYLPFEHSEDTQDQATGVRLFEALLEEVPATLKQPFQNFLDFAKKHKEIVDGFKRFPHRNTLLGRDSTPEELEFLKGPGSSF